MAEKLWFGTNNEAYDRNNARYYNVQDHAWAAAIEQNWPTLQPEIQKFISESDNNFISNEQSYKGLGNTKGWHSISSLFWGMHTQKGFATKCPLTYGMLQQAPGIVSISFSKLEPNTKIGKHHGETNAIIRCHLGIEIPAGAPECAMNVSTEVRGWEEGKWVFFNDAQYHYAWNNTDKRRILLIVDVIRPEFLSRKNYICSRVLGEYALGKRENKYAFIRKLPSSIKKLLVFIGIPFVYLLSSFSNIIKK